MLRDLSDGYAPLLSQCLDVVDTPTRKLLRPAVRRALGGIEKLCPQVAVLTRDRGMVCAYGPTDEAAAHRLLVLVATTEQCIAFGSNQWPRPIPPPGE